MFTISGGGQVVGALNDMALQGYSLTSREAEPALREIWIEPSSQSEIEVLSDVLSVYGGPYGNDRATRTKLVRIAIAQFAAPQELVFSEEQPGMGLLVPTPASGPPAFGPATPQVSAVINGALNRAKVSPERCR